jgi:hypothetical protein
MHAEAAAGAQKETRQDQYGRSADLASLEHAPSILARLSLSSHWMRRAYKLQMSVNLPCSGVSGSPRQRHHSYSYSERWAK